MGNNLDTSRIGTKKEKSLEFGYVDRVGEVDWARDACKGCGEDGCTEVEIREALL